MKFTAKIKCELERIADQFDAHFIHVKGMYCAQALRHQSDPGTVEHQAALGAVAHYRDSLIADIGAKMTESCRLALTDLIENKMS